MRAYVLYVAKRGMSELLQGLPKGWVRCSMETYGLYDGIAELMLPEVENPLGVLFNEVVNTINKAGAECVTCLPAFQSQEKNIPDTDLTHVYLLINCLSAELLETQQRLIRNDALGKADIVYGPFGIIADLVVKDMADLRRKVVGIRQLSGIVRVNILVPSEWH